MVVGAVDRQKIKELERLYIADCLYKISFMPLQLGVRLTLCTCMAPGKQKLIRPGGNLQRGGGGTKE